jgi:hypothetical protein
MLRGFVQPKEPGLTFANSLKILLFYADSRNLHAKGHYSRRREKCHTKPALGIKTFRRAGRGFNYLYQRQSGIALSIEKLC